MDGQPNQNQFKQDRLRTRWTTSLNKIFANLVVEQVQQGKRSNNVFTSKHGSIYVKKSSISKQHTVTTDYEAWEDHSEAQPKPEAIKVKDCPIYEQLCTIFSEPGLEGMYAQSSHYAELNRETARTDLTGSTSCPKATSMPVDPATSLMLVQDDYLSPSGVELNMPDGQKKRLSEAPSSPSHRRRSREGTNDALAEAMLEMAAASRLRAAAMSQNNDEFSITNCIRGLDDLPGVDHQLYFVALDLFEKPNLRETFLSLRSDKRLTWLHGKCPTPSISMV